MTRPNTYFIDIDGCILHHEENGASNQWHNDDIEPLGDVHHTLDVIESRGDHIVLVTARPEHMRADLVARLRFFGIVYHQLVMGVTSGHRILVNDMKSDEKGNNKLHSASAINLKRNYGIKRLLTWQE